MRSSLLSAYWHYEYLLTCIYLSLFDSKKKGPAHCIIEPFVFMRDQRVPRPYGWGIQAVRKTFLPHHGTDCA